MESLGCTVLAAYASNSVDNFFVPNSLLILLKAASLRLFQNDILFIAVYCKANWSQWVSFLLLRASILFIVVSFSKITSIAYYEGRETRCRREKEVCLDD